MFTILVNPVLALPVVGTCSFHVSLMSNLEFPYSWFTLTTVAWEKSTVVATLGSAPFFCTHSCKTVCSQTNPVFVHWFQQMPSLYYITHSIKLNLILEGVCLCVEGWAKGRQLFWCLNFEAFNFIIPVL